jgi:hypothetical protein
MQPIVDCFIFNNELDLLEIRLNSLKDYVSMFILIESATTHSGHPKPLTYELNKQRFAKFNIRHIVLSELTGETALAREICQRDAITTAVSDLPDDTMLLLSDVDEIPDMETFTGSEGVFIQSFYYYYVNTRNGEPWGGTVATTKKNLTTPDILGMPGSPQRYRDIRCMLPTVGYGWHFSTLGPIENIIDKIESYSHQEFNTDEYKAQIRVRADNLTDYLGRNDKVFTVKDPSGPKYLLDNRAKYSHLFYQL